MKTIIYNKLIRDKIPEIIEEAGEKGISGKSKRTCTDKLLKAIFGHIDEKGKIRVEDIVDYFIDHYNDKRDKGEIGKG